jgi:hypothetical protein
MSSSYYRLDKNLKINPFTERKFTEGTYNRDLKREYITVDGKLTPLGQQVKEDKAIELMQMRQSGLIQYNNITHKINTANLKIINMLIDNEVLTQRLLFLKKIDF